MEQIKLFIDKVQSDSELAAKLSTLGAENADAIAAAAKEHGFAFTAEEWGGYIEQAASCGGDCSKCGELSVEELDAVSGGSPRFIAEFVKKVFQIE